MGILKQNFQAENSKNVNVKFSHCSDDFFLILQRGIVRSVAPMIS